MAMSRGDYEEIANVINDNLEDTMVESRAIATMARELADVFKANNPRFRYDTFFAACGLDEWGEVK